MYNKNTSTSFDPSLLLTWSCLTHLKIYTSEVLSVSCDAVAHAIRSFKAGSAGGLDRLRPQHFKELISKTTREAGVCVLKSLTSLVNYVYVIWEVSCCLSAFL